MQKYLLYDSYIANEKLNYDLFSTKASELPPKNVKSIDYVHFTSVYICIYCVELSAGNTCITGTPVM